MRSPWRLRFTGLLCLLVALACGGGDSPAPRSVALEGVPIMPQSVPTSTASGAEAVQVVFRSGAIPDSVAGWYRRWFLAQGWVITGDNRAPDGSMTLHAEKAGRPLWIMIQPGRGRLGSTYSVVGAEPDTGASRAARR